jgi:hypothetical protein
MACNLSARFLLTDMSNTLPIGNIIKQKLKENDRSISWLARKVHLDSSNFLKKLNHNNIELDLLLRISVILQEDFFIHCSKIFQGENSV